MSYQIHIVANGDRSPIGMIDGSPAVWTDREEAEKQISLLHDTAGWISGPPKNFVYELVEVS